MSDQWEFDSDLYRAMLIQLDRVAMRMSLDPMTSPMSSAAI